MVNEWQKVQMELNRGFQEQISLLNECLKVQLEVNNRLEKRVAELENFNKKLQGDA